MNETFHSENPTTTPTIEVSVYRGTALLQRELVETEQDAAALVAHWEEERGVECQVLDLAAETGDPTANEISWDHQRADHP